MDKIEAESLRAQSQTLAKELGIDRAVRDCIHWMAYEAGRDISGEGQRIFLCQGCLDLMIDRGMYRETVTVRLLVDNASVIVYTAWRKYPYPVASPTIEVFKPGMWTCALLTFAEKCREQLQKLAQEREQELIEQMVDAFAPMDDWEGIDEAQ